EAARRCAGDGPLVLVGYSSGGLIAHGAANLLESMGSPPAAVVVLDTYVITSETFAVQAGFLREQAKRHSLLSANSGTLPLSRQLGVMGGYLRILESWQPKPISAPNLIVRATQPVESNPARDWQASTALYQSSVEVPGSHFTIMSTHAESTAKAVHDWLTEVL